MKNALRIFAAAAAFSLAASALPAYGAPAAQNQEHHDDDRRNNSQYSNSNNPDYSNNSYYQLGNREGYQDYGKKQQRKEHRHRFRNDDDRAAHDYGYQQGWSGQQYNSRYNNRGQQSNQYNNRGQSNDNDRHMNDTRDPH
jgi:hypothetical protein